MAQAGSPNTTVMSQALASYSDSAAMPPCNFFTLNIYCALLCTLHMNTRRAVIFGQTPFACPGNPGGLVWPPPWELETESYSAFTLQVSHFNEKIQCQQASQITEERAVFVKIQPTQIFISTSEPLYPYLSASMFGSWVLLTMWTLWQGHHLFLRLNSIKFC